MKILLSNDDGYQAPGLAALEAALIDLATLTVVAPEQNHSGASNSLTLGAPLRIRELAPDRYAVNGTPTDCVHVAITGLMSEEPDMVVAGINSTSNLGDDTLYSGTVAAATEGRFLGLPAIAISLNGTAVKHYDTAAQVAAEMVKKITASPLPHDTILNINVPDIPFNELNGFRATRLGNRHKSKPVIAQQDPRGQTMYWIGPAGDEQDGGEGTDFHALREGFVSVTPLQIDLTRHDRLDELQRWLN